MENIDKPLDEVIAMDADAKPAPVRRGGRPPKQSGQGGKVRSDPTTRERAPAASREIVSARRRTSSTPTRELSSPDDRRSPVIPTRRLAVTRAMATTPAPPTA